MEYFSDTNHSDLHSVLLQEHSAQPLLVWLVNLTMLLCWRAVAKLCEAILLVNFRNLLPQEAVEDLRSLKRLEKFMDNRSIKEEGRNVPPNIFNPMMTDAGVWRAAGGGYSHILFLDNNFGGQSRHPGWMNDWSDPNCNSEVTYFSRSPFFFFFLTLQ